MSTHILLNLLNELRKRDKMQGIQKTLSLFRSKFNEFNNIRMSTNVRFYLSNDVKIILKSYFCHENVMFLPYA